MKFEEIREKMENLKDLFKDVIVFEEQCNSSSEVAKDFLCNLCLLKNNCISVQKYLPMYQDLGLNPLIHLMAPTYTFNILYKKFSELLYETIIKENSTFQEPFILFKEKLSEEELNKLAQIVNKIEKIYS